MQRLVRASGSYAARRLSRPPTDRYKIETAPDPNVVDERCGSVSDQLNALATATDRGRSMTGNAAHRRCDPRGAARSAHSRPNTPGVDTRTYPTAQTVGARSTASAARTATARRPRSLTPRPTSPPLAPRHGPGPGVEPRRVRDVESGQSGLPGPPMDASSTSWRNRSGPRRSPSPIAVANHDGGWRQPHSSQGPSRPFPDPSQSGRLRRCCPSLTTTSRCGIDIDLGLCSRSLSVPSEGPCRRVQAQVRRRRVPVGMHRPGAAWQLSRHGQGPRTPVACHRSPIERPSIG